MKILNVNPINFNLKSNLEKEAILNSYKLFLKTCNFNIQILIQSSKENIEDHIKKINKYNEDEIKDISNNYINYIKKMKLENKATSKKFFILIKRNPEKTNINIIIDELNSDYFKIKECLSRCGNTVTLISSKKEARDIINSFLNIKSVFNKIN